MNHEALEKEVKFFINDLAALRNRLLAVGAVQVQPRTRETNFRFDTPGFDLAKTGRALRLRQDQKCILTFKGPTSLEDGVRVRPESEVEISDIDNARNILTGLGYVQTVVYEKFRAAYLYKGLEITLDELPYGNFSEIEGADSAAIQAAARVLALDWDERIQASYLELFERIKKSLALSVTDLTFKDFAAIAVTHQDLGVKPADLPAYL
ncbi:MAG TPA: class IV adenylate cyclase [Anaerolineaceae bacterium]|nr:class IV adenylate cyclase [Anaerolineaceae bacterium]